MKGPNKSAREKEIEVEMICDQAASLPQVNVKLQAENFPPMNDSSYTMVKKQYCPVFKKFPELKVEHYRKSLTLSDLKTTQAAGFNAKAFIAKR